MKYKSLKKVPFQGNSNRCLVLRMLYAQKMLAILHSGKTVYNVDETFLNETCFKRKKWCQKGEANTFGAKMLGHRISMVVALGSDGDCYFSFTQVNTDANVMLLFFSQLAAILQEKDDGWREKTVFLIDGASYHKESKLRDQLLKMGIQVVISAPYSFQCAPIELLFA